MPKVVDRSQVRDALLVRAFDHFALHGFHGATMRSLSDHLRVTTGTLYHYFAGKEDLFSRMLLHMAAIDAGQLLARVRPDHGLRDRLRVLLRFLDWKKRYFQKALFLLVDVYRFRARGRAEGGPAVGNLFADALGIYARALDRLFGPAARHGSEGILSYLIGSVAVGLIEPRRGRQSEPRTLDFFEHWIAACGGEGGP